MNHILLKLTVFVSVLLPLFSPAQDSTISNRLIQHNTPRHNSYTLKQFAGKWQEVTRMDRKVDTSLAFKDTMCMYFFGDNDVTTRDGVSMSLKGKAAMQPGNILEAAADIFVIKYLDSTKAILDDREKYVHTFYKRKSFSYENFPTDSVTPEKLNTVKANFSVIRGKWIIYRRDAPPGTVFNDELLIRVLNIKEQANDASINGEVTFYRNEDTYTEPCSITLDGETMYIVTEKHAWHMDIYKADGKDFIFGDPALMYYCKLIAQD